MSRKAATLGDIHPLLWWSLGAFAAMTVVVVTSPLPVLLDAYLHDDSFYYLTVAENLAAGHGSTFDRLNVTNGYQPAWLAMLAAMYAAGVGHDQMVTVAIVVQAVFLAVGAIVLSLALIRNGVSALPAAAAPAIVYFGAAPALGWDLLEAGLNVLTSAGVLLAFTQLCGPGIRPVWFGVVLTAAALARTDHLVFLPIGGVLLLWQVWHDEQPRKMFRVLAFGLVPTVVIGSYLMLNVSMTGHVMPISGVVKRFMAPGLWASLPTLAVLDLRKIWMVGLMVGLCLVVRDGVRRRPSGVGAYALGALTIFGYYLFNVRFPADAFWHHIPLYALLCYGIAVVLEWASHAARGQRPRVAVVAIATVVVLVLALRFRTLVQYLDLPEGERSELYRVAQVLNEMAAGTKVRVGSWDAGILGYYAGPVTNLDGLVNSGDYFDRYLSLNRTSEYIREHALEFVVGYEWYFRPGGHAPDLGGDYVPVFEGRELVILKRIASGSR